MQGKFIHKKALQKNELSKKPNKQRADNATALRYAALRLNLLAWPLPKELT